MELYQRVEYVAKRLAGSVPQLAKVLSREYRTFKGYLSAKRQDNLWPLLPEVLAAYPQVSRDWLYFGEGEPWGQGGASVSAPAETPPLAAQNRQGRLTGDLLRVVLDWAGVSEAEAARKTGIGEEDLRELLDSRRLPDFARLEALYLDLGIEPSYFFDGNEKRMWLPDDPLLRIFWALGMAGRTPTWLSIADLFDLSPEEAKDFHKEWKAFRERGERRTIPGEWLEILAEKYGFNPGWPRSCAPPLAVRRETSAAALRQRVADLEKLAAAQEEVLRTYRGQGEGRSPDKGGQSGLDPGIASGQ